MITKDLLNIMNKTILSIETSTNICSVGLFNNNKTLSLKEDSNRQHSALLAVFVDQIFKELNFSIDAIDAIALSIGPGSYTGLRIGLSFAKGLAFSIKKPIIPIDTIDSLTENITDSCYMVAIHGYSDYYFIQKYKNNLRFDSPFFDKIENISNQNIYGYGLPKNLSFTNIVPSSKNIYNIACKNYNKYKCDNIKLIKPNYIKPIQFKNKI